MAGLLDPRIHQIKIAALDLIQHMLRGWPHRAESEADTALIDRCKDRVREGLWLLIREALSGGVVKRAALDVIELVDEDRAVQVRIWLEM